MGFESNRSCDLLSPNFGAQIFERDNAIGSGHIQVAGRWSWHAVAALQLPEVFHRCLRAFGEALPFGFRQRREIFLKVHAGACIADR